MPARKALVIHPDDISSLTDFKRDTPTHLRRLKKTGRPQVLTVNGKAVAVVLDSKAYQKLAALIDEVETLAGIQRGLASFQRGEGLPARQALEATLAKIKSNRRPSKRGKRAA
jgi:prevent-host-death family protein